MPVRSSTSSGRSSPESDQEPSRRWRARAPSRSCSSAMSPTISSTTSSRVTMPAWPPYSSRTTAIWKPSSRSSASSGSSRSESGTTIGLTIRCLTRVVGRSCTRQRDGVLDVHGADDGVVVRRAPGSGSGRSARASSMTALARSLASRLMVRTRGVMISPAVRVPNSTERSISSAVSASRVPWSAERCDQRGQLGGAARRAQLLLRLDAEAADDRVGRAVEHPDRAAHHGGEGALEAAGWPGRSPSAWRCARFLGTSSPKIIVSDGAERPGRSPTATGATAPSGTPSRRAAGRRSGRRSPARRGSRWPGW